MSPAGKQKRRMPFWAQMLIGMGAGIAAGLCVSPLGLGLASPETLKAVTPWIALPADLFMALIMMIVMPLVFCSVLLAVTSGGTFAFLRTVGATVMGYFVLTTFVAVWIGVAVSGIVKPASHLPENWVSERTFASATEMAKEAAGAQSVPEMIVGLVPVNPAAMFLDQEMLQIVIAAILGGLALLAVGGKRAKLLNDVCDGIQEACMKIVTAVMYFVPVAVFGFLFRLTVEIGPDMLRAMSAYIATVLAGLLCIAGLYLCIVAFVARRNPLAFLMQIRDPLVLAFSSSSSAATLPVTLRVTEENLKVRPEIANLVVPLGTVINMDGTAMYQVVVALFLTQMMGIDLTAGETVLLCVTIVGAAIGTPGTPGVGLVILATILARLGVPPEAIGIILSVDRLLDMCRTTINVMGDTTAAVLMERFAHKFQWEKLEAKQ